MIVLSLNQGSSSLKAGLHRVDASSCTTLHSESFASDAAGDALDSMLARLASGDLPRPEIVAHRIVHGGPQVQTHCMIDDAVMAALDDASLLAPLHAPASLTLIRHLAMQFPDLRQVACLDTRFHASLPDVARVMPIPRALRQQGVVRYGFHGLSCESILQQLGDEVPARTVIAHLGNGSSVTAVREGLSADTSMGLTPTGGVVMGTRSGELDPGVLIYLMRMQGFGADELEALVNQQSGLLGISGLSGDMRVLRKAAVTGADARMAIQLFGMSVRKQIAAMTSVLGGLDLLVFTGGIGEHDAQARIEICSGLAWLGLHLDPHLNASSGAAAEGHINTPGSACSVRVMATREEARMARLCWTLAHAP